MTTKTAQPDDDPVSGRRALAKLSRRQLLQTAMAGGIAASVATGAGVVAAAPERARPANHPLEEVLSRYGSEFGRLDRVRVSNKP